MKKRGNKIRISVIYIVFIIVITVILALVVDATARVERSIVNLQDVTDQYIEGRNAVTQMREASDYLTEEARAFVITGDEYHALNYIEEASVIGRRDEAVEMIKDNEAFSDAYGLLQESLNESNRLMNVEYYAMKLAADAYGIRNETLDEVFSSVVLSPEDMDLSRDDKIAKSTAMLFDDNYDGMKKTIINDTLGSLDRIMEKTREQRLDCYETAEHYSKRADILLVVLIAVIIATLVLTALLIVIPVMKSAGHIRKNEPLPEKGAYEYAYLASTYNSMREQSNRHTEQLSYEATHDELTGLYNRKVFEEKLSDTGESETAMICLDVDNFKGINDTYGHAIGDRVLKKVSDCLSSVFRLEDYVCRIGGDEFVVFMVNMKPELKEVVVSKMELLKERISVNEGLPEITLSIGIAFTADAGEETDLYKKADSALYAVKEKGRDGYCFYSDLK